MKVQVFYMLPRNIYLKNRNTSDCKVDMQRLFEHSNAFELASEAPLRYLHTPPGRFCCGRKHGCPKYEVFNLTK